VAQTTSSEREIRLIAATATACGSLGIWASSIMDGAEWIAWTMAITGAWLLAVGATAAFRTVGDPVRPTSFPGLALPSIPYGAAIGMATWATMPLLTWLIASIGTAAAPATVLAVISGTAALLVIGRIMDVSIDPLEPMASEITDQDVDEQEERKR
jgi:hypothetical protein